MRRTLCAALGVLLLAAPAFAQPDKQACADAYEKAQYAKRDKHLRAARAHSLVCAQQVCGATAAADCGQWLRDLEQATPTVVFSVRSAAGADLTKVIVSMDGEKLSDRLDGAAIAVDPGAHTFRFEAEGALPIEQNVTVQEGEKSRVLSVVIPSASTHVSVQTPTTPIVTSRGSMVPGLVVAGVGLATTLASIVVGVIAKSDLDTLRGSCAPSCSPDSLDAVKVKAVISDVLLGVGIAGVGAGVLMIAFRPLRQGPTVGLRGTTLVLSGTF